MQKGGCILKSKTVEFSEWIRENYPINGNKKSFRRLIHGVGINDADYLTHPEYNGTQIKCPIYRAWYSMVERVYSDNWHKKQPTYCSVKICKEWLLFSNFRKWFIGNYIDSYHLDKDILSLNNKIYSPETCIYIPQWLNNFTTNHKSKRGKYKIGVSFHKYSGRLAAKCSNTKTGKQEHLGLFEDEDQAHNAWLKRKLELVLELKPEMDEIDLRIYPNVIEIINCS